MIEILVDQVGAELMLSKLTATVTVFFWNYASRNNYVFPPRSVRNP